MNRVIRSWDLDAIYVIGPGHGGPAIVANAYLEGTYSEVYPSITRDEDGMRRLFRQFSFPGGIPSHVAPETPGSIHEGGELGYALVPRVRRRVRQPRPRRVRVVGDGEAETGPLATSWHSNKFLDPARDGAVLPILHLNGYKIANPTVLARIPQGRAARAHGGVRAPAVLRRGRRPADVHQQMAATLDAVIAEIQAIQKAAREGGVHERPRVADDRAPDAQGLDRAEGDRRQAGRGHVACPPGADRRGPHQRRAPGDARGVDAQLPARRAVRRAGHARPRARAPCRPGRTGG